MSNFIVSMLERVGSLGKTLYDICSSSISFLGFDINFLAFCGGVGVLALFLFSLIRG